MSAPILSLCWLVGTSACGAGVIGAPADSPRGDGGVPVFLDANAGAPDADAGSRRPAVCAPTAGGPIWVEEGATVVANVRCGTGVPARGDDFTLTGLPDGAGYDPTMARLTWKTALDQAAVYTITLRATRLDEIGELKIGVADKFYDPKNAPIADPTTYTEEFGLPVFHLRTTPQIETNLAIASQNMRYLWSQDEICTQHCLPSLYTPVTITYRGHTFSGDGRYHGQQSLDFTKKSYGLRFPKSDLFSEPTLAGGKIANRRKIVLITPFSDNSYIRGRLGRETWNRLNPTGIHYEHYTAIAYVDGDYKGLYHVVDHVDADALERNGLDHGGNLFDTLGAAANFSVFSSDGAKPKVCPYGDWEKLEGEPPQCTASDVFDTSAFGDLFPLLDFVAKSDDARFRSGVGSVIEVKDVIAWLITATSIYAADSFEKNCYFYHDPVGGGPWRMLMWGFREGFGRDTLTFPRSPTMDSISLIVPPSGASNNLWKRLWSDSTYGPRIRREYGAALKGAVGLDEMLALVDSLLEQMGEANQSREERRWGQAYEAYFGPDSSRAHGPLTTHSEEVAYLRKWITTRWNYLKTKFP